MNVIIPLAGFGTRLRPHTYTRPKPLINVAGKPVLGHILDKLQDLAIDEIVFVVGYLGNQVQAYVDEYYDFKTHYVEQKELLGQAHAIYLAKDLLEGPTIILFVDTLFEANLSRLSSETGDGVIYVKEVPDPRRFGVTLVNEAGHITRLIEKPSSMKDNLAVIGLYYVKEIQRLMAAIKTLMDKNMQTKGEFYLADALQLMIDDGAVLKPEPVQVWLDCGKPETVLETNRYLLEHNMDNSREVTSLNSIILPPVHIDPSVKIKNSIIGPYVTVAAKCEIEDSIIRDSIVDEETYIKDAMLQESLIGRKVDLIGRYRQLNLGDSAQISFL
ncbi:MAG: NTP transferase domain-containing protein [Anaerolineae bacterium]|nr:NTP transferase domain-containing protein [Anaerolineae bacterium]